MPSITNFSLSFDNLNESGTFSEGDTVSGMVLLELNKSTKILSLGLKAKGDVDTKWNEVFSGPYQWQSSELQLTVTSSVSKTYSNSHRLHERLFKEKQLIVSKESKTTLPPGRHQLPFRFTIPSKPLPSSFRGAYGSVAYTVEATLRRQAKKPRTVQEEISLRSKSVPIDHPQRFRSGTAIELSVDRTVCSPGDHISVRARIRNNFRRDLEPIFILKCVEEYRSRRHKKMEINCLQTVFKDAVRTGSQRDEACVLKVPADAVFSVDHSEALSVRYYVYLSLDALPALREEELPVFIMAPGALPGKTHRSVLNLPGPATA